METNQEQQTNQTETISHPLTQQSYTSKFFGNYLDNSQIDLSGSDISMSIDKSENDPTLLQERLKSQSLLLLGINFKRRIKAIAIQTWWRKKECLIRLQKRTPTYITKVLLKISMFINVKIKSKCHIFFSKAKKMIKELKVHSQQHQSNQPNDFLENLKQSKTKGIISGLTKLIQISQKLTLKYFNQSLQELAFCILCQHFQIYNTIFHLADILNNHYHYSIKLGWNSIKSWIIYLNKVEIMSDAIGLILNQILRSTLLQINLNAIREIQQEKKSRIQSQHTIEAMLNDSKDPTNDFLERNIESSLVCQSEKGKNQGGTELKLIDEKYEEMFKKKSENRHYTVPEISLNSIKEKKMSQVEPKFKEEKRIAEGEVRFTEICQKCDKYSVKAHSQGYFQEDFSISKPQEVPSSAVSSPRNRIIIPKKAKEMSFKPLLSYKIATILGDKDCLHVNISESSIFTNVTQSLRSRPLKNDDLHHEFTDFNDLFFSRETLNFYQLFEPLKQNTKNIHKHDEQDEEYGSLISGNVSRMKRSKKIKMHTVASETFIEGRVWNCQSRDEYEKKMQYGGHAQSCNYLSPPPLPSRTKQYKIPTELPSNFDYYANKAYSRRKSQKKSSTKSDEPAFLTQRLKDVANSVSKKKLFNIVKPGNSSNKVGGLRLGEASKNWNEGPKSNRRSTERKQSKNRDQLNTSRKSGKKNRQLNGSSVDEEKGQYLMTFRGPPKKKIKRNP